MNYEKNILKVFNLATESEKVEGINWYNDAKRICQRLAKKHGQSIDTVARVMAVLSPNNKWQRNILDTDKVLELYKNGTLLREITAFQSGNKDALLGIVATYRPNLVKAYEILSGNYDALKGEKVNAFASNILDDSVDKVTIDFHAYSIATGIRHTVKTTKKINAKEYEEISQAYRNVSKKLGLLPKQVQAVTWVAWRNIDKLK